VPVIGTAGHVDHGKSTLVRALTGRDPDRWEEERRRGLTIDLGFAWCTLPGDVEVAFVDVPGHERFMKNMLAGIEAVDAALLVVAADEGWMPQSEEHLQVLDLLGITRGVVALTRADLVGEDLLDVAELEVRDRIAGTSLEDAPVVRVGAPAGVGVTELRSVLAEAVTGIPAAFGERPRLWVDRAFTIGGSGTVVTGTLLDGPIAVGDGLALWPGERPARVRGLHRHEQAVDRIDPGTRAAVNLGGVDHGDIERGMMLGAPGDWYPTKAFLADVRTVRSAEAELRDRGAYHLHVGAGTWPAQIRLVDQPAAARPGAVLVRTRTPLPLKAGDRFIIRDVGRRTVVAGGIILDPHPPLRSTAMRAALGVLGAAGSHRDDRATALLAVRGLDAVARLAADSGGGNAAAGLVAGGVAASHEWVARASAQAAATLERFHEDHPLRAGMPRAELASTLQIDLQLLEALIAARSDVLAASGPVVRASSFAPVLDEAAESAWDHTRQLLAEAGAAPPRRDDLDLDNEQIHALLREGRLVAVSSEFVYLPETLDAVQRMVADLPDGFTVADFRDAVGITRRHAIPLLEWGPDGAPSR
jgi:selenocysteine-specific elongation factor